MCVCLGYGLCVVLCPCLTEARESCGVGSDGQKTVSQKRKELFGGWALELDDAGALTGDLDATKPPAGETQVAFEMIHRLLLVPVTHVSPANGDRPHPPEKFAKFARAARDKVTVRQHACSLGRVPFVGGYSRGITYSLLSKAA